MPNYYFADAHCHLSSCTGIIQPHILHITSGFSNESNIENSKIAQKYENVFLCAGISPQEAMRHKEIKIKLVEWEERISSLPKLVAIGEIGLDFHWAKTEEERFLQHECFISQLVLAERLNLPVVIHSREAEEKCLEIISGFSMPFLMHCFSGKVEIAVEAAKQNALLSIPPIHGKERRKFISSLPLEKLLVESDAPFIGKTPSDTMESIKMIAEIKGVGEDIVREQTLFNTISFFKLK